MGISLQKKTKERVARGCVLRWVRESEEGGMYLTSNLNEKQKLASLGQVGKILLATESSICERAQQKEAWTIGGIEARAVGLECREIMAGVRL